MGITPDLATGVWVGAEDRGVRFRSTDEGQGARVALPIYGYFMNNVYKDPKLKISKEDFEKPEGFDKSKVNCNDKYYDDGSEDEDGEEEETESDPNAEPAEVPEELNI